jgi:hypothetical protein
LAGDLYKMSSSSDFMVRVDLSSVKVESESRPELFSCLKCSETFESRQTRDLHVIEIHDNVRAKVRSDS